MHTLSRVGDVKEFIRKKNYKMSGRLFGVG